MNAAVKKGLAVLGVALVLLIPLAWLHGLVGERTTLRDQAAGTVARGWGGEQLLSGPVLIIPVTYENNEGKSQQSNWYVLPESLNLDVDVSVQQERRKLGVYEVPVYVAKVHATGTFDPASEVQKLTSRGDSMRVHAERARLFVPMSDTRGVRQIQLADSALASAPFEPSLEFPITGLAAFVSGGVDVTHGKHTFDVTLEIAGTQALHFLPLARASQVKLRGNWPNPGFTSGFLPVERHVQGGRFEAAWQILDLNRLYGMSWLDGQTSVAELQSSAFGVDLVQPVDLYQQVDRATKYAGVFIGLTFLTLFIWENLARRALHPIQYALMGLALSVFFLLLLALAEHVGFLLAYSAAALALCTLLGIYLAGAMRSAASGVAASGMFALLYGLLYLLVTSDDYSLLTGSLGLFVVLSIAMILTRKVDWYQEQQAG